jgi:hypothetical protein
MKYLSFVLVCLLAMAAAFANVDPATQELRYCGAPKRDVGGNIVRSSAVTAAFQKAHPCPSTGKTTGACQDWSIDHVIPLACGGCDAVSNMQWLHNSIKSAAGTVSFLPKDRFERKIDASTPPQPNTSACKFQIIPPASAASGTK